MTTAQIQAIMSGLVVLAAIIASTILITSGHDTIVGIIMLAIVGGYLGIDLSGWIPTGKNTKGSE